MVKIMIVIKKTFPEESSFDESTVCMSYTIRDGGDPDELLQKLITAARMTNDMEVSIGACTTAEVTEAKILRLTDE